MGSVSKRQINKINLPLNSFANTFPQHHSTMSYIIAKDNSGASKHYFRSDDIACLSNVHPTAGPSIYLPNMQSITSTYTGMLPVPMLTSKARTTHILPQLHSASLISLGQLCDDDSKIYLNKKLLRAFKNNRPVLHGVRNNSDGLWDIEIPYKLPPTRQSSKQLLSVIIPNQTTRNDLINFFHGACFSPLISTFLKAVKNGNFQSWPGLTPQLITKYLRPSAATHFDYLNQEWQNL